MKRFLFHCLGSENTKIKLTIICLSFFIHIFFIFELNKDPTFYNPLIDSGTYDSLARKMVSGSATKEPFFQPPLYPFCLATVYCLSGGSILTAKLLQGLFGTITALLTFSIAKKLFNYKTASLAGILITFYGPLLFFQSQLLPSNLAVMLNMLALWQIIRAIKGSSISNYFFSGILIGIAAIAIPNVLSVHLLLFILGFTDVIKSGLGLIKRSTLNFLAALLGTLIIILPITVRNYLISNQFVPISTNGGVNLYIGNNPDFLDTINIRPGSAWYLLLDEAFSHGSTSASEDDSYFLKKTLAFIVNEPISFVKGLLIKASWFINSKEHPRTLDIYMFKKYSHILNILVWRLYSFSFPWGIIFPLAFLGLIKNPLKRSGKIILIGYLTLYSLSVILFFVSSRYRLPVIPIMVIFASHAILWLSEHRDKPRKFFTGILIVLPVFILSNLPLEFATDRMNFEAETSYLLGLKEYDKKNYPGAIKLFNESIIIDPNYSEPYKGIGDIYYAKGQYDKAISEYKKALSLKSAFPEALLNLGSSLSKTGRIKDAVKFYREVTRLKKRSPEAYTNLGIALLKLNMTKEAVNEFRKAIVVDPSYMPAKKYLSVVIKNMKLPMQSR